jgi:hypothetical protein
MAGRTVGVKARYSERKIETSSVTLPALGEAAFSRLQKSGFGS